MLNQPARILNKGEAACMTEKFNLKLKNLKEPSCTECYFLTNLRHVGVVSGNIHIQGSEGFALRDGDSGGL